MKWMVMWLLLSNHTIGHGECSSDEALVYTWSLHANITHQEYAHWIQPCEEEA